MKFVLKLGVIAAVIAGIAAMEKKMAKRWLSMSEDEVRSKVHDKMAGRMPAEKEAMLEDKIVEAHRKAKDRFNGHLMADA